MQDDRNTGTTRSFFPGGRPYEEHRYDASGHEAGPQRVWYQDGSLRANYTVRDGRRYGTTGPMECAGRGESGAGPSAPPPGTGFPPPRGAFGPGSRPFPPPRPQPQEFFGAPR
jgi:hypothetical protein